ncbi:MAG: hypothetical protein ACKVZ0_25500, partial [Gemmatimonadales bacterium]
NRPPGDAHPRPEAVGPENEGPLRRGRIHGIPANRLTRGDVPAHDQSVPILRWALLVALAVPFRAEATLVARDLTLNPGNTPNPAYRWINQFPGVLTYDTDTGLEWVDLTETLGMSRSFLLSGNNTYPDTPIDPYHNPFSVGWRYATFTEVCGLFEPRTGPLQGCSDHPGDLGSYEGVAEIQALLGVTDEEGPPPAQYSFGIFETGEVQIAVNPVRHFAVALVINRPDDPPSSGTNYGHLLVRVPEPGVAALLACLALATAFRRCSRAAAHDRHMPIRWLLLVAFVLPLPASPDPTFFGTLRDGSAVGPDDKSGDLPDATGGELRANPENACLQSPLRRTHGDAVGAHGCPNVGSGLARP